MYTTRKCNTVTPLYRRQCQRFDKNGFARTVKTPPKITIYIYFYQNEDDIKSLHKRESVTPSDCNLH